MLLQENLGAHLLALKSLSPHPFGFHGKDSLPPSFPPPRPPSSSRGLGEMELGLCQDKGVLLQLFIAVITPRSCALLKLHI